MKNFFRKVLHILLWIWQFPQNICGLFAILLWRKEPNFSVRTNNVYDKRGFSKVYLRDSIANVTLGEYIHVHYKMKNLEEVIQHETGHVIQSRIFGPLYLPIIGVLSAIWVTFGNYKERGYYVFFVEKWANKLAGLKVDNFGNPVDAD